MDTTFAVIFLYNEEIFVKLDELEVFDRITQT